MINHANTCYFNSQPIMTDNQYDVLKEFIEDKFPETEFKTESLVLIVPE